MKWVPGTETLIRAEILMETVNYIKTLQEEIKEVKKKSKELEKKIKELETSETVMDTNSALMPHRSFRDMDTGLISSEMVDGTVVVSTPMERPVSSEEEKLLRGLNEGELLLSPEELPEFNSVEDLRKWLGLDSSMEVQTTSEEIPESASPEEELPEFNSVEALKQWLGL